MQAIPVNTRSVCRTGTSAVQTLEGRRFLSASFFSQHNLVSDGAVHADHVDHNLQNPWGLAAGPGGPAWVANNGTHTATLYDFASGSAAPLVVHIRGADDHGEGEPTGEIFNQAHNTYRVSSGGHTAPAVFMFAGEDGTISAWSPRVDATNTVIAVNRSAQGAVYKGLAQDHVGGRSFIYATDFANGRVDVFDSNFSRVTRFGTFHDPQVPSDFHPFGIQQVGDKLVVTYAKHVAGSDDEAHGAGLGYVTVWSADGHVVARPRHTNLLNAPWGVALAPRSWHDFAGDLLIGNFGSGDIVAYDPHTLRSKGTLNDSRGHAIHDDGLWAIHYGSTPATANTLFFTAGLNDEADGLFGSLTIHAGA